MSYTPGEVYKRLAEIKYPETVTRHDGDIEVGHPGWQREVTPIEMLTEILYACANADTSCEEVGCTVGYFPGETPEEHAMMREVDIKWGLPERPPRPGAHHVSLWRRQWRDDSDDSYNHSFASFVFTTDPDLCLWEG